MPKQRVKEGDVLAIKLSATKYAFARVFDDAIGVYDKVFASPSMPDNLGKTFMFVVTVYRDDLTSGAWPKVKGTAARVVPQFEFFFL